jgi:uncharacterized protein YecE (DUF72 family)
MEFFIGCSGFHYKHWKGKFYPRDLPERKWFEYYCMHFSSLELNVTFYRFPELSTLQRWYLNSPENFNFSVKVPRIITHYKKFHDTETLIRDFYQVVDEGLKEKLGCVLFQMPPSFIFSRERLDKIIASLDPSFRNVVEFRHRSWWQKEVYDLLEKHHISFCGMSHPDFPADLIRNTVFLYYRMHGIRQTYSSGYSEAELKALASELKKLKHTNEVYIYFNNDVQGFAISNAQSLISQFPSGKMLHANL